MLAYDELNDNIKENALNEYFNKRDYLIDSRVSIWDYVESNIKPLGFPYENIKINKDLNKLYGIAFYGRIDFVFYLSKMCENENVLKKCPLLIEYAIDNPDVLNNIVDIYIKKVKNIDNSSSMKIEIMKDLNKYDSENVQDIVNELNNLRNILQKHVIDMSEYLLQRGQEFLDDIFKKSNLEHELVVNRSRIFDEDGYIVAELMDSMGNKINSK